MSTPRPAPHAASRRFDANAELAPEGFCQISCSRCNCCQSAWDVAQSLGATRFLQARPRRRLTPCFPGRDGPLRQGGNASNSRVLCASSALAMPAQCLLVLHLHPRTAGMHRLASANLLPQAAEVAQPSLKAMLQHPGFTGTLLVPTDAAWDAALARFRERNTISCHAKSPPELLDGAARLQSHLCCPGQPCMRSPLPSSRWLHLPSCCPHPRPPCLAPTPQSPCSRPRQRCRSCSSSTSCRLSRCAAACGPAPSSRWAPSSTPSATAPRPSTVSHLLAAGVARVGVEGAQGAGRPVAEPSVEGCASRQIGGTDAAVGPGVRLTPPPKKKKIKKSPHSCMQLPALRCPRM